MTDNAGVIVVDDFGVDWSASGDVRDFETVADVFMGEVRAKNRSQWILGDLYAASDNKLWQQDIEEILSPSDLSLGTVRNYASVCNAWHKSMRVVPCSFSHYQATAKLVKSDPVAALRILETCKAQGLDRNYARVEAAKALNEPIPATFEATLVYTVIDGRGVFAPTVQPPTWIQDGYQATVTFKEAA